MGKTKIIGFLEDVNIKQSSTKALLAANSDTFDPKRHRILKEMGLTRSVNFINEQKVKHQLSELEDILDVENFVKTTKNYIDGVEIIEYSKLLLFCKNNNLLFGKANLFRGNIPKNVIDSIVNFNFDKINSLKPIEAINTIVKWVAQNKHTPEIFIAASPHHFNGNKGFISNKEVISSKYHSKLSNLSKNKYKDTLVLTPVIFKSKIYFIIIKIW